jgi:type I site-specific restriction-modification system R (restriction) subunit
MNQQALSSLIWSVADLLRGDFKQSEYGRVILPFTVLRRLDCVLAPTKVEVLKEYAAKQAAGIAFEPFVKRKSGLDFYNVSSLDMGKLMGDQDNIRANLDSYIQGFAPDVRSIFEHFDFAATVERLHKAKLLYLVTEKFAGFDLHPAAVDNMQMGLVFEELIRKFAEISNETAGEHFTPREPLLAFPGGALVHFAVSNAEAAMTTRLAGLDTVFLPFNQGNAGGAGNPSKEGIATDYLWKEVWQRDSFLQILGRYLVPVKNDKKQLTGWIFPRYHQLKVTRKLVAAVAAEGPGHKYLVQHSAGSGKTNSIAWSAHFLADLHDAQDQKVFDTVIVISDRTVLDTQLREAIESFERTRGVVAVVTGEGASKSKELAEALSAGKKIVVCTIQTFPFALEEVRKLAATRHKRFAVIADEAHSSQTNETAAKLKLVLSAAELAEVQDGGEISTEDILAAQMSAKANADEKAGITYVAFTATPKEKTLQLFGTRPDSTRPAAADNLPAAFDVYSMRQAIEEGFILDVLKTYTSYKVAFSLAHHGKTIDSREVDRSEAMKGIMGWVRLHEYNIAQRVQVVVEHYRKHVAGLLGGKAKAMVVTGSRKEAVFHHRRIPGEAARQCEQYADVLDLRVDADLRFDAGSLERVGEVFGVV